MAVFIAVVRKLGEAAYAGSFPDFPGLAVNGRSLDELLTRANEVLAAHVERLLAAGNAIGLPTSAGAIERDDALLLAAVEIPDDLGVANVTLEIPALALARIDALARRHGLTRSALFIHAANRWEMEELLPRDRRSAVSDHPTLFDFHMPPELKVEAATAAYPPLHATTGEKAANEITEDGGIVDMEAELERLIEQSSSKRNETDGTPTKDSKDN